MNQQLHLDFESRSAVNIKAEGVDRYVRHASTQPLMLAWAFNDEEPDLWFPGTPLPTRLHRGLISPAVTKVAWQARFERGLLRHKMDIHVPISQWRDPAVYARYATIPNSLADASRWLGLGDLVKHEAGKALIRWFSIPKKDGTFRDPADPKNAEKWRLFCEYCKQDVRAERGVDHKLAEFFALTDFEREVEQVEMEANERGWPIDMPFVRNAAKLVADEKASLKKEMQEKTGLANPNSGAQLLPWLQARGYPFSSLGKAKVKLALKDENLLTSARDVLLLRGKLSRSSTSKLDAILLRVADDGRLRHNYKYLGANRTGRWGGEGVQLQNLPR